MRRPHPLAALLLLLLAAFPAPAADESRFDPPLDGAYLGISGRVLDGRFAIEGVERFSAADLAGLLPGDQLVRLGPAGPFRSGTLGEAMRGLRAGQPVEIEVLRTGQPKVVTLFPDPLVLRDHYALLSHLRASEFLASRAGSAAAIAEMEAANPTALRAAARQSEACEVLNRSLGRLGTSHTAVIPPWTYRNLFLGEHEGAVAYATGLLLETFSRAGGDGCFACDVLDGSPSAEAGVRRGDEVLAVNGVALAASPRRVLAGYEASRPHYTIQVEPKETITVEVRRTPGAAPLAIAIAVDHPVNAVIAAEASLRRFERDRRRLAYLHLPNLLSPRAASLVARVLGDRTRYVEALVADLRGRGGQVTVTMAIVEQVKSAGRPVALLIDRDTRSAKEITARLLKGRRGVVLVGEPTAGAVLPGAIVDLPGGIRAMIPVSPAAVDRLTGGPLEGKGVEPDVWVERPGPYSAGEDPILEAGIRAVLDLLRSTARRARV